MKSDFFNFIDAIASSNGMYQPQKGKYGANTDFLRDGRFLRTLALAIGDEDIYTLSPED